MRANTLYASKVSHLRSIQIEIRHTYEQGLNFEQYRTANASRTLFSCRHLGPVGALGALRIVGGYLMKSVLGIVKENI